MQKPKTVKSTLAHALEQYRALSEKHSTSCFLPALCERLGNVERTLSKGIKTTPIKRLRVGVTCVMVEVEPGEVSNSVLVSNAPNVFPIWEEDVWLPYQSFVNLVSKSGEELAWRTSNWILSIADTKAVPNHTIIVPKSASLSATLWLCDAGAEMLRTIFGEPLLSIDHSGFLSDF